MVCARGDCTHRSVGGETADIGSTDGQKPGPLAWPGRPRWLQQQLSNLSPTGAGAEWCGCWHQELCSPGPQSHLRWRDNTGNTPTKNWTVRWWRDESRVRGAAMWSHLPEKEAFVLGKAGVWRFEWIGIHPQPLAQFNVRRSAACFTGKW